jgi:hypothetical protein
MTDFVSAADHAMGLELQLEELVEQRQRALVQHRPAAAQAATAEIDRLQDELAETAAAAVHDDSEPHGTVVFHG